MPETESRSDHVTEATIARLIDTFYERVRQDPVLAPVFEAAIDPPDWPDHLSTMRRFWSSVMLTSGRYSGNPVAVHRAVHGIERAMFTRWINLFEATARDLFTPETASLFAVKAGRIAASLQLALFHRLGEPPDGLALPPRKPDRRVTCD
jgi:hemoglobin